MRTWVKDTISGVVVRPGSRGGRRDGRAHFLRHLQTARQACVPFSATVLAAHLIGPDVGTAVTFYSGVFIVGSVASILVLEATARGNLFLPAVDAQRIGATGVLFGWVCSPTWQRLCWPSCCRWWHSVLFSASGSRGCDCVMKSRPRCANSGADLSR
jgi:hypothetical protein